MKITIDVAALHSVTTGQIAARSTADIYEHALLVCNQNTLTLTTRNVNSQYSVSVDCTVIEAGACTANPVALKNAIAGLEGEVMLSLADNKLTLSQAAGKRTRRFNLDTLPAADWPLLALDDPMLIDIDTAELLKGLQQVSYAAAKKDVRYYLNGVYLGQGSVVATDGHRMAVYSLKTPDNANVVIPRDNIAKVMALLAIAGAAIFVNRVNRNLLSVTAPGFVFITSLIDGKYPDYNRAMPADNQPLQYHFNSTDARAVVNRCQAMEQRKYDGQAISIVCVKPLDGYLSMSGNVTDDFVPCKCAPSDIKFGVNARYLSDALNIIGDAEVNWQHGGVMETQRITSNNSPAVHVIMPVKL